MNKIIKNVLIFSAGLLVGSAGGYVYARKKYEVDTECADYEIGEDTHIEEGDIASEPYTIQIRDDISPIIQPTDLTKEDVEKINELKGSSPIDYANKFVKKDIPTKSVIDDMKEEIKKYSNPDIYVIEPEEYGENEEYGMESLILTADGCVVNEKLELIYDPAELLGDCLEEMGKYEDDAIHVRNDIRMCDYEVLRDIKTYDEINELYSDEELTGNE